MRSWLRLGWRVWGAGMRERERKRRKEKEREGEREGRRVIGLYGLRGRVWRRVHDIACKGDGESAGQRDAVLLGHGVESLGFAS